MNIRRLALILGVVLILLLFNLFTISPPLTRSSIKYDFTFGEAPSKPYLLRVRVERSVVDGVVQSTMPVARLLVKHDEKAVFTNLYGYAYFVTSPGKHVVELSSPQQLMPTYTLELEVNTQLTELRVTYFEHRFKIEAVNVTADTARTASYVTVYFSAPANVTGYYGNPYLTYMDFKQYLKVFAGSYITSYRESFEPPYQGPFTYILTSEDLLTATAEVQDLIEVIWLDKSYVSFYTVENEILRMS